MPYPDHDPLQILTRYLDAERQARLRLARLLTEALGRIAVLETNVTQLALQARLAHHRAPPPTDPASPAQHAPITAPPQADPHPAHTPPTPPTTRDTPNDAPLPSLPPIHAA